MAKVIRRLITNSPEIWQQIDQHCQTRGLGLSEFLRDAALRQMGLDRAERAQLRETVGRPGPAPRDT